MPNDAARVVARAMQRYGLVLTDGGNVALTARSDRNTTAKWAGMLGPRDLDDIAVTDFEVVDGGERFTGRNCVREAPVPIENIQPATVPALSGLALALLGLLTMAVWIAVRHDSSGSIPRN